MARCKIVVSPGAERHASGEPYKTKRHEYPVSQRGWREAVRHAKKGSFSGEPSTIFLACPRGDIRIADCHSEAGCRLDDSLGGNATRVLAGGMGNDGVRREPPQGRRVAPPPALGPRQGPPPGVPLRGARRRRR